MNAFARYSFFAFLVLLIALLISRTWFVDPAKQQQHAALSAVRRAFQRATTTKESSQLVPYKYHIHWPHLFSIYAIRLKLDAPARFAQLRSLWGIDETSYHDETLGDWSPMGDSASGLSGSLFFRSEPEGHLLIKSLGREFEVTFLHQHFLPAYFDFVHSNPQTLINRILDVLYSFELRVFSTAPGSDWEMFDLKPTTYLEPVRDLLPEQFHTTGVTDVLPEDRALLTSAEERESILGQLHKDTQFLASLGAIDYSILLVRKPDGSGRVAIIDVFWSLRTPRGKLTKQISVDAAGVPQQTVTADAEGYAREVMKMMEKSIIVRKD
ncbi:hypothetical protein BKA62DRAFT_694869 [Auriculariales sp. MPI-PUGE-AT-0066]|nr:hypothetical protein BKA62DRAFT_694869 [Auriculariales sp. MPI-PUGE-AT-0066]